MTDDNRTHQRRPELGNLQTGADGKPEWFLHNVVAPLYDVLSSEGKKMRHGELVDHRERKHYDDINEFFWTSCEADCTAVPSRVKSGGAARGLWCQSCEMNCPRLCWCTFVGMR